MEALDQETLKVSGLSGNEYTLRNRWRACRQVFARSTRVRGKPRDVHDADAEAGAADSSPHAAT